MAVFYKQLKTLPTYATTVHLKPEILKEHSKAQCTKIVNWVGHNQQRFDELFELFLTDEYQVAQRAAWPVSYCITAHPPFINKHWKNFIGKLKQTDQHNAVKRNSISIMQEIELPQKYHGEIMDICFVFLESPTETLAVKVFAMTVLGNLAIQYPEIKTELKLLIEDQLPGQTPGFKSRGKKILKQLECL